MSPASEPLDRRTFLADLGRGTVALAIVTMAGCSPSALASFAPSPGPSASTGPAGTPDGGGPTSGPGGATPPAGASDPPGGGVAWQRVNLGFVSAYILARGGEAALVDTGVSGSEAAIEAALGELGLGWGAVGHVILTHLHGDHVGSLNAALAAAPAAAGYAGAPDIPGISSDRALSAVGDGDTVFDLRIVTSPGHTAGSISVLDPIAGVLVAGDAMGVSGGMPTLPGAQFTADLGQARQSVMKLGGLTFETLLVGHGEPIEAGAAPLVAALGAG